MSEPILRLQGITKNFGEEDVLHGIDLDVMAGEFLTLLGPSGCGKTTTLRIIAGLERPTSGTVLLDGVDITKFPPEKRSVNTVFQSYALFPHMNVAQNVGYGLKLLHPTKDELKQRVAESLRMVQLEGYEKRMPAQLSGGQKQRVAIARALVLRPKVLLLDEPLGALDLQLRRQMQEELKRMQRESGVTFIYITHDQEEALNMSTRIVIMNGGHIQQIGSPEDVYERPANAFAAGFIGQSNLLRGVIRSVADGSATLDVNGLSLPAYLRQPFAEGDTAVLCLRPQRVLYGSEPKHSMCVKATVLSKEYSGGMQHTRLDLGHGVTINAVTQTDEPDGIAVGSEVCVGWDVSRAPVVPDGGER